MKIIIVIILSLFIEDYALLSKRRNVINSEFKSNLLRHNGGVLDLQVGDSESIKNKFFNLCKVGNYLGFTVLFSSITTSSIIQFSRQSIGFLENIRVKNPLGFPLLGGVLISFFLFLNKNIATKGPPSLFEEKIQFEDHIQRVATVILTVGCGNSLAFVGTAAEIGMAITRLYGMIFASIFLPKSSSLHLTLIPQLCFAGAAAGVAANFEAPLTGLAFATEV
jgi:H+/Cl- antiporter ClcA